MPSALKLQSLQLETLSILNILSCIIVTESIILEISFWLSLFKKKRNTIWFKKIISGIWFHHGYKNKYNKTLKKSKCKINNTLSWPEPIPHTNMSPLLGVTSSMQHSRMPVRLTSGSSSCSASSSSSYMPWG